MLKAGFCCAGISYSARGVWGLLTSMPLARLLLQWSRSSSLCHTGLLYRHMRCCCSASNMFQAVKAFQVKRFSACWSLLGVHTVRQACFCCRDLIQCLRRLGPAHCYATSMSAPAVEQVISSMDLLRGKDGSDRGVKKIQQLHDNANYFRRKLSAMGCSVLGSDDSPVMVRLSLLVLHALSQSLF